MTRLWLDTSVFATSLQNHQHSNAGRESLVAVEQGTVEAVLAPVVLCELAYMLVKPIFAPPNMQPRTTREVADYLMSITGWARVTVVEHDIVGRVPPTRRKRGPFRTQERTGPWGYR